MTNEVDLINSREWCVVSCVCMYGGSVAVLNSIRSLDSDFSLRYYSCVHL